MDNSSSTKPKVITVRKANYILLLLPIGLLVLTIGTLISMANPAPKTLSEIPKAAGSDPIPMALYGFFEVYVLVLVAQSVSRNKKVSVENISAISWVTSFFITKVNDFLQLPYGHWSQFLSIILLGIPAILVIITLLQDKPFAGFTMYQDKRIIER